MNKKVINDIVLVSSTNNNNGNIVTYDVKSKTNLWDAAYAIAVGQSVGNPEKRSEFESRELFETYCAKIIDTNNFSEKEGLINIYYPDNNFNYKEDGITHFLTTIMGGQLDIDIIQKCRITNIEFSKEFDQIFNGPNLGLKEMRKYCGVDENYPLFGGIIKPKIGLNVKDYVEVVKIYADNGCNFIKEDEILSNQSFCSIEKRLEKIGDYLRTNNIKMVYAPSITCDHLYLEDRIRKVHNLGINGLHINIHSGYGAYKMVKDLRLNLYLHYQKSGDKMWTNPQHNYSIDESVLFEIASRCGCSTLHVGMIGGYLDSDEDSLVRTINKLVSLNSVSALSCGMHPGLVQYIINKLGHCNWMANVGGAISSHPMGSAAGVRAMKQSISGEHCKEYRNAIKTWGLKS
jgi:ribulose 1,5-bisphosphate carboxylase large subunit-like protein